MNSAESPPETEKRPARTAFQTGEKSVGRLTKSDELSNREQLAARVKQFEQGREYLLELACADPDQFGPLIRPAAQIDKAARLIKEFLEPRTKLERWWER